MATALEPAVKEKKIKNRLRNRFLLSAHQQASSLDVPSSIGSSTSLEASAGERADGAPTASSTTVDSCNSRVKRMLFRRARSETVDSSAEDRPSSSSSSSRRFFLLKADSVGNQLIQETSAAPITEAAPVHLSPRSPPPPYDTQSDTSSIRSNSISQPPSYDEAMAQTGPNDVRRQPQQNCHQNGHYNPMEPVMIAAYCSCGECQERYSMAEEEQQHHDDNCADAVFPMETHVLMQEVLADGMAFCNLM